MGERYARLWIDSILGILFDIKVFFETGGYDRKTIEAFLFYLISHNRPFHEMLKPNVKDVRAEYESDFEGMAEDDITLDELEKARIQLFSTLGAQLTESDKALLLSIAAGKPEWSHFSHSKIQEFPSVRWRTNNIQRMDPEKKKNQWTKLAEVLG